MLYLTVIRDAGRLDTKGFIEAMGDIQRRAMAHKLLPAEMSGATVANLSPALADELSFDVMETGVIVVELRPGSTAQRFQFQPGDIIRAINGEDIDTVAKLKAVLARRVDSWRIGLERNGKSLSVVINR